MSDSLPKIRVVFDCNVLVQAALYRNGPAAACLRLAENGSVELYVTAASLNEVREVLQRPKLLRKYPAIRPAWLQRFISRINSCAVTATEVPAVFTLSRDPDDAHYLDLAVVSGAAFLVSRDQDLLHLPTSNSAEAAALRQLAPNLEILDPVTFLTRLRPPADEVPPEQTE